MSRIEADPALHKAWFGGGDRVGAVIAIKCRTHSSHGDGPRKAGHEARRGREAGALSALLRSRFCVCLRGRNALPREQLKGGNPLRHFSYRPRERSPVRPSWNLLFLLRGIQVHFVFFFSAIPEAYGSSPTRGGIQATSATYGTGVAMPDF